MFNYVENAATCWRPDLVPVILKWLARALPSDLELLRQFRMGPYGEFVAVFDVPTNAHGATAGATREVTVRFDHDFSTICTDSYIWLDRAPLPLNHAHLTIAANRI